MKTIRIDIDGNEVDKFFGESDIECEDLDKSCMDIIDSQVGGICGNEKVCELTEKILDSPFPLPEGNQKDFIENTEIIFKVDTTGMTGRQLRKFKTRVDDFIIDQLSIMKNGY